ncbi:type VI secretion system baseplate subunit TssF [Methylobacterium sp. NEAU 140]|uniref:type VI secretion system baseplate subunit TssF n=1 Tax=Methylobacterium sp. NEAU 140 TaxID=3064945 RepID=UPI0027348B81|nr:type VI secretion system baseplate subunit TssF [Methylobacterium sp. NEAU 140]MDP4025119.1 type VI secretion system baseplate subunit TssF [Methylobacterium sp. NEAU 140]
MNDAFLGHYNDELASIRAAAAAFAADHPRIAGRLRVSEDAVEDPFVERLIESFAFLTARVRQKLDDDFPELTDALLGILYPHYQNPIPSMAIVQMEARPELAEPSRVPAGTLLDTEPVDGERCRYRTAYPVAIHPLRVREAMLARRPFQAPPGVPAPAATACLRLTLETTAPELEMAAAAPGTLRLFLRGQPSLSYGLYETLLNDAVAVAFAADAADPRAVVAGPDCIAAVGFEPEEGLLPYPDTAHIAYRLLTEYFTLPEKFLFLDLRLPEPGRLPPGRRLDVFVYLRQSPADLERTVSAEAFALNCTPIVNLFPQIAEPIALNQTTADYRVVPDSRRVRALEVYGVERATIMGDDGERRPALPFYAIRHADLDTLGARGAQAPTWWLARREPAGSANAGSETHLALVDLTRAPSAPTDEVLSLDLTCLNRDLPQRLPFGGGHPYLSPTEPLPSVAQVRALTAPTPTLRPAFRGGRWQLVSHLALNHLSLAGPEGLAALREILLLYDLRESAETRALVDGVVGLSARPGTARVRGRGGTAVCRGIDIEIVLDPTKFSGNGAFLMASVLERFLGLYVSVNSFTRLTATLIGRTGILRTWPPRSGDRVLL